MFARVHVFTALLAGVDFLDEFSGVGFVGAADLRAAFRLPYRTAAVTLFVAPQLCSLLLEAPVFALADRWRRKWLVVGGLAGLGVCDLAAGAASSFSLLAAALALAGPAGGVGVGLAQATLVDSHPREREQVLARWTLMGCLGDLGTPLLFAVLARSALGWREAFAVSGLLLLTYAAVLALCRFPEPAVASVEDAPPLRAALAAVRRNRPLLTWLFGAWLCSPMDEVLVAFASLHLSANLGAGPAQRSLALAGFMAGAVAGLLTAERLLRRVAPLRLLRWAGSAGSLVYLAWLAAPGVGSSAALLGAVGFCAAPLYPIVKAQAYRALPGRSGAVNAAAVAFIPLEMALPFALGLIADRVGLRAALALLVVQPAGLLALALRDARGPSGRPGRRPRCRGPARRAPR
jgi:predicted MFS family arabinose efflux permease